MLTGFAKCTTINVTGGKSRRDYKDSFEGAGRIMFVVDPRGWSHHFYHPDKTPMTPDEINEILTDLGVSVRVDNKCRPYELAEAPGVEDA